MALINYTKMDRRRDDKRNVDAAYSSWPYSLCVCALRVGMQLINICLSGSTGNARAKRDVSAHECKRRLTGQ